MTNMYTQGAASIRGVSYLVFAMPFVTDATEVSPPSVAFLALRVAFFLAALDLAAAFADSRSAHQQIKHILSSLISSFVHCLMLILLGRGAWQACNSCLGHADSDLSSLSRVFTRSYHLHSGQVLWELP